MRAAIGLILLGAYASTIQGAEILKDGREDFARHCSSCHQAPAIQAIYRRGTFANGARVQDATVLTSIRDGHSGAPGIALDERTLFCLLAYLKSAML